MKRLFVCSILHDFILSIGNEHGNIALQTSLEWIESAVCQKVLLNTRSLKVHLLRHTSEKRKQKFRIY